MQGFNFLRAYLGFLAFLALCSTPTKVHALEAHMPINVKIVNLTNIPLHEAIGFCDDRGMDCPALREKYEQIKPTGNQRSGSSRHTSIIRVAEHGYYIE